MKDLLIVVGCATLAIGAAWVMRRAGGLPSRGNRILGSVVALIVVGAIFANYRNNPAGHTPTRPHPSTTSTGEPR